MLHLCIAIGMTSWVYNALTAQGKFGVDAAQDQALLLQPGSLYVPVLCIHLLQRVLFATNHLLLMAMSGNQATQQ